MERIIEKIIQEMILPEFPEIENFFVNKLSLNKDYITIGYIFNKPQDGMRLSKLRSYTDDLVDSTGLIKKDQVQIRMIYFNKKD